MNSLSRRHARFSFLSMKYFACVIAVRVNKHTQIVPFTPTSIDAFKSVCINSECTCSDYCEAGAALFEEGCWRACCGLTRASN